MRLTVYRCHCGRDEKEHADISEGERSVVDVNYVDGGQRESDNNQVEEAAWDPKMHLGRKETNAYGEVVFHKAGKKSTAKV